MGLCVASLLEAGGKGVNWLHLAGFCEYYNDLLGRYVRKGTKLL
jgi:hypothetical protein